MTCPRTGLLGRYFVILLGLSLLVSVSLSSCSSGSKYKSPPVSNTFFPLALGDRWVFFHQPTGSDTTFDSMWINFDSVRTVGGVQQHWYVLRFVHFLDRRIWVRRDSVGDLWTSVDDHFSADSPFMLFSKVQGDPWLFHRFCTFPDSLRVTGTDGIIYNLSVGVLRSVQTISATARCGADSWGMSFAPGVGPVALQIGSSTWPLVRYVANDDKAESRKPVPRRIMNPE